MLEKKEDGHTSSIPLHLLRQYLFCPRIPYFTELIGIKPKSPLWVHQGTTHHTREFKRFDRRDLSKFGIAEPKLHFNVSLISTDLRVHGVADAVIIGPHEGAILEFKIERRSIHRGALLQLVGYSLVAEEMFKIPFKKGFFIFEHHNKSVEVKIDEQLRNEFTQALNKLRCMLDLSFIPVSSATEAQCGQCEFIQYCNDRD